MFGLIFFNFYRALEQERGKKKWAFSLAHCAIQSKVKENEIQSSKITIPKTKKNYIPGI